MTKNDILLCNQVTHGSDIISVLNYICPEGFQSTKEDYDEFKKRYIHFINGNGRKDCNDRTKEVSPVDKNHLYSLYDLVFSNKETFLKFDNDQVTINKSKIADLVFSAIPVRLYIDKMTETMIKDFKKETKIDREVLKYVDLEYRMAMMREGYLLSSCFTMWLVRPYFEMMKSDHDKETECLYLSLINKFYKVIEHFFLNIVHPFAELQEANTTFVHALRVLFNKEKDLDNQTSGKLLTDSINAYGVYGKKHSDEYIKLSTSITSKYNEYFTKD